MREPRPDWSPLGVNFKILDEHPHLFLYSSPPPGVRLGDKKKSIVLMSIQIYKTGTRVSQGHLLCSGVSHGANHNKNKPLDGDQQQDE